MKKIPLRQIFTTLLISRFLFSFATYFSKQTLKTWHLRNQLSFKSTPLMTAYFEVEKRKGSKYSERWCFWRKYIFLKEIHILKRKYIFWRETEVAILMTRLYCEVHWEDQWLKRNPGEKLLLIFGWKTYVSKMKQRLLILHIVTDGVVICSIAKEKSKKDIL